MSEPAHSNQWIAQRTLRDGRGQDFVVGVATPRAPAGEGAPWSCDFRIVRAGQESIKTAYGSDGMQALALAIEGLGLALEKLNEPLHWIVDGEVVSSAPGDTGFYQRLPGHLGLAFYRSARQLLEDAGTRHAAELRAGRTR